MYTVFWSSFNPSISYMPLALWVFADSVGERGVKKRGWGEGNKRKKERTELWRYFVSLFPALCPPAITLTRSLGFSSTFRLGFKMETKSHLKGVNSHKAVFLAVVQAARQASLSFTVSHSLLRLHVHWIDDAIQPSHPLSPPSLALSLSQHQGLFQWVGSSHQVAKILEFQLQHRSFQWIFRTDFLKDWLVWSHSPRDSQESSPTPQFEGINSLVFCLLYGPAHTTICDHWEDHSLDYTDLCQQSDVSAFQHIGLLQFSCLEAVVFWYYVHSHHL